MTSIDIQAIVVTQETSVREALAILARTEVGALLLVRSDGTFERSVSCEDLRRLSLIGDHFEQPLSRLPHTGAPSIHGSISRRDALALMNQHGVDCLPVLNQQKRVVDVLKRKDIDEPILLSTPHMGNSERGYVEDAFRSNWIAPLGPNVTAFEREFADLVAVRHAAALSSGTAAIHLALNLLGVGPGDHVFCSTLTFAASANPIVYLGAQPVFIDSDKTSWNMSASALEAAFRSAIASRNLPKAVIIVNLYGQSADMDTLQEICNRYGVPIVEDAAESLGAKYKGRASGSIGDLGVFSFNGNKIITTSGGGMLVSDDPQQIEKARFLATQARDPAQHYQHSQIGYNYRMSNILAGVGRGQIEVLSERVRARRAVFERYRMGLSDISAIEWTPEPSWSYSTRWLSTCTVNPETTHITRNDLIDNLAAELIEARPVWKPLHLQPIFSRCEYFSDDSGTVSDGLFANGLCLPSSSNLPLESQDRIISTIRRVFGK